MKLDSLKDEYRKYRIAEEKEQGFLKEILKTAMGLYIYSRNIGDMSHRSSKDAVNEGDVFFEEKWAELIKKLDKIANK